MTNLASLKRLSGVREKAFRARKRAHTIHKLFTAGLKNRETFSEHRYRIIRYEDLVSRTEETMREIAAFLDIQFLPSLLVPTENGRPAISNSMYAEARVQGRVLDQSRNTRFLEDLTPREREAIRTELNPIIGDLGYDWSHIPRAHSRWWPLGRKR